MMLCIMSQVGTFDAGIDSADTQTNFVRLKKPKYKEEYSTEECARFQPWRVVLKVELDDEDPEPVDYEMFCRANSPDEAQFLCHTLFNYWTHVQPGNMSEYPQVSTEVYSEAEKLTEDQWYEFLKEANRYPNVKLGMKDNPSVFRFVKVGWDNRSGILGKGNTSIITPGAEAWESVKAEAAKIDAAVAKHQ